MENKKAPDRYQKQDLIRIAKEAGFGITPRLIDDWVGNGLLDSPERRGLGRGKGIVATWSENQLQILLTVLDNRKDLKKDIKPLYNIPVWIWLECDDEYVPIRQMKRALSSWCGSHGYYSASFKQARQSARNMLDFLDHPKARKKDRKRLVEVIATANYGGERYKMPEIRQAIKKVLDPENTGRIHGPSGAHLSIDDIVRLIEARLKTIERIKEISDEEFNDARKMYAIAQNKYWQELPRFASDKEFGRLFSLRHLDERVNTACMSLITIIGMQAFGRR